MTIDILKSISSQLSFFCCPNVFFDAEVKKDIERYVYCQENNVKPYKGSYGDQPFVWVEKYFAIKSAYAKREQIEMEKNKQKNTTNTLKGIANG